jgi:hypothetical protein
MDTEEDSGLMNYLIDLKSRLKRNRDLVEVHVAGNRVYTVKSAAA